MSCVNSDGYSKAAEALRDKRFTALAIRQVIPILTAADAAANALDIASKQDAIAQRQVSLAEEQLAQAQLAWPCEETQISESNTPPNKYQARYDQEVNKAGIAIRAAFGEKRMQVKRSFNRYSRGAKATALRKLCLAEQIAVNDSEMLAYMTERERVHTFDDLYWNRKLGTAALGKNINAQTSGYYNAAGNSLAGGVNGSLKAFQNAIREFSQNSAQYYSSNPFVSQDFLQQSTAQQSVAIENDHNLPDYAVQNLPQVEMSMDESYDLLSSINSDSFNGGVGAESGTSILADSTVKQIKVIGQDSNGDQINITVEESNITYTNAKDADKPTTQIDGY